MDDSELLRAYADRRSESDFAEFVRRHLDFVYGVARQTAGDDSQVALEVSQTVFLAAARRARQIADHPLLIGWLYHTARHAAIDAVRREARRRRYEQQASAMNDLHVASDDHRPDDPDSLRPAIFSLLDRLSREDREAILQRFFEGRGFQEMAEKLGLTQDGARKRVERALERLRIRLAKLGITSTTAALTGALTAQAATAAPVGTAAVVAAATIKSATAAGAGGSAGTWLISAMNTKWMIGAALVAAVAFDCREASQWLALRAAVRADAQARATSQNAIANATRQVAGLKARLSQMEKNAAAVGVVPPRGPNVRSQQQYELSMQLRRTQFGMVVDREYGTFLLHLGLPADAALRLRDILIERQMEGDAEWRSASDAAAASGATLTPADQAKVIESALEKYDAAIRSLVGEGGCEQLNQFECTLHGQSTVDVLAPALEANQAPLSSGQADALIKILSSAQSSRASAIMTAFDPSVSDDQFAQAAKVLTPEQLQVLADFRGQTSRQQALRRELSPPSNGGSGNG